MVLSLQHWLESEAPSATTWLSKVVHNCWLCSFRPCSKFAKGFQPLQRSWKYFRQSRQLCSVRKVRLVKNVATFCNGCCLMQTFQWNKPFIFSSPNFWSRSKLRQKNWSRPKFLKGLEWAFIKITKIYEVAFYPMTNTTKCSFETKQTTFQNSLCN